MDKAVAQETYERSNPDTDIIEQEHPVKAEPFVVKLSGISPVLALPARRGYIKQSAAQGITPTNVLSKDPKIKRVWFWGLVAGLFVGNRADIMNPSGGGGQLPANGTPVPFAGVHEDIWMVQTQASVTANQAQPVYYSVEYWTD